MIGKRCSLKSGKNVGANFGGHLADLGILLFVLAHFEVEVQDCLLTWKATRAQGLLLRAGNYW